MQLSHTPSALVRLVLVLLSHTDPIRAVPTPREEPESLEFGALEKRDVPCGVSGQYTCTGGEACYTNAQQIAYCSMPGPAITQTGGGYAVYTTTYTEAETFTSTYSSWYPTTTSSYSAPAIAICNADQLETSCGSICCAGDQVCAFYGSCAPKTSSSAYTTSYSVIVSTMATTTSTYSAPLRPTSGSATTGSSATTTESFIAPATASGSSIPIVSDSTSSKLSGGAIAGIVIGTIAGVIFLLLICFCCILKAGFDGLLAIFGLGKDKKRSRERVEITEERYSRHGSGPASRRDTHTGWFGAGGRPAKVDESRKKKSSGFAGLEAVGAGLLGLAVILGLKRKHDKKEMQETRTEYSSTYYTDSYTGTSESSASSDRRTRNSRHSRAPPSRGPPSRGPPSRR